jgi:DNA repair protein RadC
VIATEEIVSGTVNQCVVYPRVVIEKALQHGASSILMAHNHPGGSAYASESDWQITGRLYAAGKSLDISLLDHIIIVRDKVISLRDQARWPK